MITVVTLVIQSEDIEKELYQLDKIDMTQHNAIIEREVDTFKMELYGLLNLYNVKMYSHITTHSE